jgi:hypothetical protein
VKKERKMKKDRFPFGIPFLIAFIMYAIQSVTHDILKTTVWTILAVTAIGIVNALINWVELYTEEDEL